MKRSKQEIRSIDDYHAMQPLPFREKLEKLRLAIQQAAPGATETISYGMPAFRQNKVLVYYALHKEHIGFYPTPGPIAHFNKELEKYKTSKGAVQFPLDKPLPLPLIRKMVRYRIEETGAGLSAEKALLSGLLHELPADMEKALRAADVAGRWNRLTPVQRNEWICWVSIVRKAETRLEHIQRMTAEIREGQRQPCCWPGCPHRRPSAQKWFKKSGK
jgi:uncharacterized protein YdhG (YjbR/CyaY superfamily)